MIGQMLRRIWIHLLITFYDSYTIEGFEKTNKKFELPADLDKLDSITKRQMTICNLFANQNMLILEIVRLLDSSLHQVVPTLIEHGLIKERRRNRNRPGAGSTKATRNTTLSILPDESAKGESDEPEPRSNAAKARSRDAESQTRSSGLVELAQSGRRMAS